MTDADQSFQMSDTAGEISVDISGGLAVLTIDRPHARNAIGLRTFGELERALDSIANSDASVVVFRGAGDRAFVSGGDVKELSAIRDEAGAIVMASRMRRLLDRLSTFPVPVIAAVNGHAIGGGAEVALAADIRMAADDINVGFTQVKLGVMPAWGGAERLAEIVGRSRAILLIGTGQILPASQALGMGLLDIVCPRSEFDSRWRDLAQSFASLPPGASRSIKATIAAARPHHHPDLEHDAVVRFARLWAADTHWEAVRSFEKDRRK